MAKPMKTLELHYPMIQFLIIYVSPVKAVISLTVISLIKKQPHLVKIDTRTSGSQKFYEPTYIYLIRRFGV